MGEFGDIFTELGLAGLEFVKLPRLERQRENKTGKSRKKEEKECGFHLVKQGTRRHKR